MAIKAFEDLRGYGADETRYVNSQSLAEFLKAAMDHRGVVERTVVVHHLGGGYDLLLEASVEEFGWHEASEPVLATAFLTLGLSTPFWNKWPLTVRARMKYRIVDPLSDGQTLVSGEVSAEKSEQIRLFSSAADMRAPLLSRLYGEVMSGCFLHMILHLETQHNRLVEIADARDEAHRQMAVSSTAATPPPAPTPVASPPIFPVSPSPSLTPPLVVRRTGRTAVLPPGLLQTVSAENRWKALLIGITDYQKEEYKLEAPVADVKRLGHILEQRFGFDVEYLLDSEATLIGIRSAFRRFHQMVGADDNVLIYFAGHGYMDGSMGYWLPSDAQDVTWGLANVEIKNLVANLKARRIILLSDSCYSGDFVRQRSVTFATTSPVEPPPRPEELEQHGRELIENLYPSREVIASGNLAPVPDKGIGHCQDHSPFACALALYLEQIPPGGLIGSNELFVEIWARLTEDLAQRQRPRMGTIEGHMGGEFFFVRTR